MVLNVFSGSHQELPTFLLAVFFGVIYTDLTAVQPVDPLNLTHAGHWIFELMTRLTRLVFCGPA